MQLDSELTSLQGPQLRDLPGLRGALLDEAADAHQACLTGKPLGPVTRLKRLDEDIGGWLPKGVAVLHGGAGVGKTAFGLQVAATCGFPALYVTTEMGPTELFRRVIARVTGTFLGRLRTGEFTPEQIGSFADQAEAAAPVLYIADATTAATPLEWIWRAAGIVKARGDGTGLLVVIDSAHSWSEMAVTDKHATEYEALNAALTGLQRLAAGVGCAVLAIAERNRASMASGGMSASAGTRAFEYGAELVIGIDKDTKATVADGGQPFKLRIEKNRHGPAGKEVGLLFRGATQEWVER